MIGGRFSNGTKFVAMPSRPRTPIRGLKASMVVYDEFAFADDLEWSKKGDVDLTKAVKPLSFAGAR